MKIGIVGNYGNENQGDEAILEGIIIQLEQAFDIERGEILVFSNNPEQTRQKYGVKSINLFQRRKTDPMKFIATVIHNRPIIRDLDVLLIGGGGILMDLYRNNPIIYGMYGLLVKLTKTPAVIYGAGAGPISTLMGRKIIKFIGNTVKFVMVRDPKSKELLKSIGVETPVEVITDPAFFVEAPAKKNKNRKEIKIGVTAVPYYYKDYWPKKDMVKYEKYINGMAKNLDMILENDPAVKVNFLSTHPNDIVVTKEIYELMSHQERCTVYDQKLKHKEILNVINEQDLLIGTRLHSLIFALVVNKPIIAVSYHQKVRDFMDSVQCGNNVIGIEEINHQDDFLLSKFNEMNQNWDATIDDFEKVLDNLKRKEPKGTDIVKRITS